MMSTPVTEQKKKMHPHKFTLWIGLGSIVMMFAGMTSAYIVKRNQVNWQGFELPRIFWYSTLVIILSSVTVHLAVKAFKDRQMSRYRQLLTATAVLGILFMVLQCVGFANLNARGVKLLFQGSNVAASFLFVITAMHILHVLGGVVVLVVMFIKALGGKTRTYNPVPVEMTAIYWHFVDILWIYLFFFLSWIQ